jgi:hypothetical protein
MEGHVSVEKVSCSIGFPRHHRITHAVRLQQHAKNEGKVVRMMPELMQREPEK